MIGFVKNLVIIFLVLTVIYIALSVIGRIRARDKLRAEYLIEKPDMPEDEFVNNGVARYQKSLRRKLIFSVYLMPLFFAGILIYLAQYT